MAEESETADEAAEMMSLVKDSSAQAWGRLAFFRAAFGSGGGQERWTGQEIRDLLTGGLATKRLAFTVSGALTTPNFKLTLDQARLAFGLAMAAGKCVPRGGVVTLVAGGDPEAPTLAAMGDGDRAEIRDETEAALARAPPNRVRPCPSFARSGQISGSQCRSRSKWRKDRLENRLNHAS